MGPTRLSSVDVLEPHLGNLSYLSCGMTSRTLGQNSDSLEAPAHAIVKDLRPENMRRKSIQICSKMVVNFPAIENVKVRFSTDGQLPVANVHFLILFLISALRSLAKLRSRLFKFTIFGSSLKKARPIISVERLQSVTLLKSDFVVNRVSKMRLGCRPCRSMVKDRRCGAPSLS